jgi:proliferating cell nuclear antigen PCNA|tara:strand:+ start:275 stop:1060 length:786 start_codon:yes stop_codon:yes gene_type:complete
MNILISQAGKCEIFSQVFQHIKLFTEHINIHFRENGLYIQTMDGSHVSIFELSMPNTWFDEYKLGESGELVIGIHSAILYRLLHSRDKEHTIHLEMPEKDSDNLYVDFTCENGNVYDRHYQINLMEIDAEQLSIPDMEYQAEFSLPSITFANLIDQFKLFGDTLQLFCSEEKINMKAHSQETGNMNVAIPIDDILSFAIDEGEEINMFFSLSHLHNICCYSKIAKNMEIFVKKECPLRVTYPLDEEECYIRFYLAPKIDDS